MSLQIQRAVEILGFHLLVLYLHLPSFANATNVLSRTNLRNRRVPTVVPAGLRAPAVAPAWLRAPASESIDEEWRRIYMEESKKKQAASCGPPKVDVATKASELPSLLSDATIVFFDVDETLVMPRTPFIYGLPNADEILAGLRSHTFMKERCYSTIGKKMEEEYFHAPLELVSPELKSVIQTLKSSGAQVFGLTSRSEVDEYSWHNKVVQNFLQRHGIEFSQSGDLRSVNGIFYAGDEIVTKKSDNMATKGSGKAMVIDRVMNSLSDKGTKCSKVVLVDNTLEKLTSAMSHSQSSLSGVHFREAWSKEPSKDEMQKLSCKMLLELGACNLCTCNSCGGPTFVF
jgi:hypothetical protein